MTELCITGTETELEAARASIDKALSLPQKGTHVGGGRHVTMPDTWDGTGACPPGWTGTSSLVRVKTATDAILPVGDYVAALDQNALSKLTTQEKTDLQTKLSTAVQKDVKDAAFVAKPAPVKTK